MSLKVASINVNLTPLDWNGNFKILSEALQDAKKAQVKLAIFPEMSLSSYGCQDMFLAKETCLLSLELLEKLLPVTADMMCVFSLPFEHEDKLYNVCVLVDDTKIKGCFAKKKLANDGVHYEHRWFTPWQYNTKERATILNFEVWFGDFVYYDEERKLKIGFEICEEAWQCDTKDNLLDEGCDIVINCSASHFSFNKQSLRKDLIIRQAKRYQSLYIYCNLLGNDAGRIIYDGASFFVNSCGLYDEAKRFSLACFTLHIQEIYLNKEDNTWKFYNLNSFKSLPLLSKEEEFYYAETLALWDYMRKSKSKGFVLSLSGGVDSSVCAVLIYFMFKRVFVELSKEEIMDKLSFVDDLSINSLDELVHQLFTCVYQKSKYSSLTTKTAAKELASFVNASFYEFDIGEIIKNYHDLIEDNCDISLSWNKHDIALQNIQARVRAPSVWMLANLKSSLLISTSNRSECAIGYTTMDGDTCGGLSPIAGVDKSFLCSWLKFIEEEGVCERITVLKLVNEQKPTAELRPSKQEDEKDLMPYIILDFLEKYAILYKMNVQDIYELTCKEFDHKYSKEYLYSCLKKFFHLWSINQWKRERFAPSFHLDDESLDPKTWCRFPILNGGYTYQLDKL